MKKIIPTPLIFDVGENDTSRHLGIGTSICDKNFEYVLPAGHIRISAFHDKNFTVLTEFFSNDRVTEK